MSYSLRYGVCRYDSHPPSKRKKALVLAASALALVIALQLIFPAQMAQLRERALPFLEPNVRQALGKMTASIEEGERFEDAAAAFCREIIHDAIS